MFVGRPDCCAYIRKYDEIIAELHVYTGLGYTCVYRMAIANTMITNSPTFMA